MVADSLNHCQQVLGSERTLAQDVVNDLQVMWPITVDNKVYLYYRSDYIYNCNVEKKKILNDFSKK